tara:strand:+ start:235 stop:567 length:333 start_codon:yes stop_codon:yes gene_type:complete
MVMSDKIDYGKLTKKIVFTDSDHRHAQLVLRLKHDGLTQSGFFRHMITAYIEGDERVQELVSEFSNQSKTRTSKSRKLHSQGRKKISSYGLNDGEIENIFDLIEQEYPEL